MSATIVFDSYWRFAAERQRVYEKRLRGESQPWTADPILRQYKFTNPFRATDRVSQFVIRHVIYEPTASTDAEEVVFRILLFKLFKLFNSIPAWEVLKAKFGMPTWKDFNVEAYAIELGNAKATGVKIWNAAYVQNQNCFTHFPTKHERYLALVEHMMSTNVTGRLQAARTYADAFRVLQSYPLHGKSFIPMQHLTDLNYSEVIDFDENDFILPGPGALDGIQKCVGILPSDVTASEFIRACADDQETFFAAVGEQPVRLMGKRRLHAIDCQNLFCETDKYARVKHPEFNLARAEIKQKLSPTGPLPPPFFPPKWGLNGHEPF
jgi:alpha-glutamyl/putrescinyl thymine pyrophosphorylase clade 1